ERISIPVKNPASRAYDCVAIFEHEVLDLIPFTGKFSLIDVYLELAKSQKILAQEHFDDRWIDVGKPESVAVAEKMFLQ
ncbi:MAG: nucleotidyltransferase family protein, partial [Niabella sp.]